MSQGLFGSLDRSRRTYGAEKVVSPQGGYLQVHEKKGWTSSRGPNPGVCTNRGPQNGTE